MLPLDELCRHIRRQRVLHNMTQAELAAEAGVSQSLVAKLERGSINPSYESVRLLLQALDRHERQEEATAHQLMQRQPIYADPTETVGEVLAVMKRHGLSQLPILDGRVPIGSVSESAVLGRLERDADLERLKRQPVRDIMEAAFPTVSPDTRRRTLVEMLRDDAAILVMDDGRLVGVVGKADLW